MKKKNSHSNKRVKKKKAAFNFLKNVNEVRSNLNYIADLHLQLEAVEMEEMETTKWFKISLTAPKLDKTAQFYAVYIN